MRLSTPTPTPPPPAAPPPRADACRGRREQNRLLRSKAAELHAEHLELDAAGAHPTPPATEESPLQIAKRWLNGFGGGPLPELADARLYEVIADRRGLELALDNLDRQFSRPRPTPRVNSWSRTDTLVVYPKAACECAAGTEQGEQRRSRVPAHSCCDRSWQQLHCRPIASAAFSASRSSTGRSTGLSKTASDAGS